MLMELKGSAESFSTVREASILDFPSADHYSAVSPFYANPTKNMFRDWLMNGTRRLAQQLPYWTIPFAIGTFHIRHVMTVVQLTFSRVFCLHMG